MQTATRTSSYTTVDIGKVVRRACTDIKMIADSTAVWTVSETDNYVHDIEEFAKAEYLEKVDVTLFSNGTEVNATCFTVSTTASGIQNERPGNALWPRVPGAYLRVVLSFNVRYDAAARARMASRLRLNWSACTDDISHATLRPGAGRSYASNAYGMARRDWAA